MRQQLSSDAENVETPFSLFLHPRASMDRASFGSLSVAPQNALRRHGVTNKALPRSSMEVMAPPAHWSQLQRRNSKGPSFSSLVPNSSRVAVMQSQVPRAPPGRQSSPRWAGGWAVRAQPKNDRAEVPRKSREILPPAILRANFEAVQQASYSYRHTSHRQTSTTPTVTRPPYAYNTSCRHQYTSRRDHYYPKYPRLGNVEVIEIHDDDNHCVHDHSEAADPNVSKGTRKRKRDNDDPKIIVNAANGIAYRIPSDDQLWGCSLQSPRRLRNHIRSAFHPKRWPAFCRSEGFRLPHCYNPGYGLGLVNPANHTINARIIFGFVEHLINIGEPRNVLIHSVSFLQQMAMLEICHQYKINIPEDFHISQVTPELYDLLHPRPTKTLKPEYETAEDIPKEEATLVSQKPSADATRLSPTTDHRNQKPKSVDVDFPPKYQSSPKTVSGLCDLTLKAEDDCVPNIVDGPTTNLETAASSKAALEASLVELSGQVDALLSTKLEIVDGKLVYRKTE